MHIANFPMRNISFYSTVYVELLASQIFGDSL